MHAMSVAAQARGRPWTDKVLEESSGHCLLLQDRSRKASKLNTSALVSADDYSSAVSISAPSFATKVHAAVVSKQSSTKSAATAGVPYSSRLCLAAQSHRLVDIHAGDRKPAVTLKCPTTVIKMKRLAPSVLSWWRNGVCVASIRSRINLVGCRTSVAAIYAVRA